MKSAALSWSTATFITNSSSCIMQMFQYATRTAQWHSWLIARSLISEPSSSIVSNSSHFTGRKKKMCSMAGSRWLNNPRSFQNSRRLQLPAVISHGRRNKTQPTSIIISLPLGSRCLYWHGQQDSRVPLSALLLVPYIFVGSQQVVISIFLLFLIGFCAASTSSTRRPPSFFFPIFLFVSSPSNSTRRLGSFGFHFLPCGFHCPGPLIEVRWRRQNGTSTLQWRRRVNHTPNNESCLSYS